MLLEEFLLCNSKKLDEDKFCISKEKLENAAHKAITKIENNLKKFGTSFVEPYSYEQRYKTAPLYPNEEAYWRYWTNGMHIGKFLLAYELTGDKKFLDAVYDHLEYFEERATKLLGLDDHDVGFLYSPSCVAAYKVTGDTVFRDIALLAADALYDHFSTKGWYLRRGGDDYSSKVEWHRTAINSMMNIPLLMWAGDEAFNGKYTNAAILQCNTTIKYLVREDGSTYHHYQFDPKTQEPIGGISFNEMSIDGCWARGQAWALYGFPIAYSYTVNSEFIDVHKKLARYFINNLPDDGIPYCNLQYGAENVSPKDSSSSAIAICGLLEINRHLSKGEPQIELYENACACMMNSLIDKCTSNDIDGLITHSSVGVYEGGSGIDECTVHGDYFYLEALTRYLKPEWKMYW